MPWVRVEERLPPLDEEVHVAGDYTPRGYGYPLAKRVDRRSWWRRDQFWEWSSREWRGMVAIRAWWEDDDEERESQ
jgi:hypothetical protein